MSWKAAIARNRFSELVSRAINDGPQRVTRREDVVWVVSDADYLQLHGKQPNFIKYLLHEPDLSDLDLRRDPSPMREVDL